MNDWNDKIEKTMVNLGCKCGAYRIMHDESADRCYNIDSYMSIISITLSTLTATSIFSLEDNYIVKIASGVVVYFIAFLTSMKHFLNYTEMSEQHKLYSIRFSALYRDIQRQLYLDKKDRQSGKEYLNFINGELDNLLFSNPTIPYKIKKKNLGDYNKNSAHEISMSKDIYDIIVNVPEPITEQGPKLEPPEDSGGITVEPVIQHYSRYQINRFMNDH